MRVDAHMAPGERQRLPEDSDCGRRPTESSGASWDVRSFFLIAVLCRWGTLGVDLGVYRA